MDYEENVFEYEYARTVEDCDELYSYDDEDNWEYDNNSMQEWEMYYKQIASEIIDD